MQFLKFEEIALSLIEGKKQTDAAKPVRALYRVSEADKRTSHGKMYTWDSLQAAVNDEQLQEEINVGALFGFIDHPPDVFDKNGKSVGTNPYSNAKVFRVESMWADAAERDIKAWVRYLPNRVGIYWSDQIRQGNYPKVSMVSDLRCNDQKICDVLKIQNFDQVPVPAMSTAVLLQHKDSALCGPCQSNPDHPCDHCKSIKDSILLNQKNSTAGVSRSADNIVRNGDAKMTKKFQYLKFNKDGGLMSLEEILGQAKAGWLTVEATVSLEFWCAAVKDMLKQLDSAKDSTDEEKVEATEMAADSASKLNLIGKIGDSLRANANIKDGQAARALDAAAQSITAFKNGLTATSPTLNSDGGARQDSPSTPPQPQQSTQQDAAIKALTDQVSALAAQIGVLTKDAAANQSQKEALAQQEKIKDGLNKLFSGASITFGADRKDEAVIYQRASFTDAELKAVRDGAARSKTLEEALVVAELAMDGLSKAKADSYLARKGFDGNINTDTGAKGKTKTSNSVTNKSLDEHPVLSKMKDAYLSLMRQNDSDAYVRRLGRDSKLVAERKGDLLKRNMPIIESIVAKADAANSELINSGRDAASELAEMNFDDFAKLFPVESQKDSADQKLVTATNTVILPYFTAFMMMEEFEPLDAMNLYGGITREGLVDVPRSSPGWGRIFNYGQEFGEDPTGDDEFVNLPTSGDQVFEEIGIETTREEFVTEDYGLAIRIARGDAAALQSLDGYDSAARLQFRALQYLARKRNYRLYRALFDVADQVNAVSRPNELVQNVAPSGSGPLNYVGEYKRKATDTYIEIGGKRFGGAGSNIDAVARVRGGSDSNSAFPNVPICRNYRKPTHSQNGIITYTDVCPISVQINNVAKTQGTLKVVNGVQMIMPLTAQWALDQDGFIAFAEGAGQGNDPTSPQIKISYYEVTNLIRIPVQPDLDDEAKFFNKYLYRCADKIAKIRSAPNFGKSDTVLNSHRVGTNLKKASKFDKQESPNGVDIMSVYDAEWRVGNYGLIKFVNTTDPLPHGDTRGLICKQGYGGVAMWLDSFSQPYRAQKTDLVTGKVKTLPQLVMDVMESDCIAVPAMKYPSTHPLAGQYTNMPLCNIIHYGTLPSDED